MSHCQSQYDTLQGHRYIAPQHQRAHLSVASMLQLNSVESLDISRADYQQAAAEIACSLKENRCTVLQLDEQSILQMETAQTALKESHKDCTATVAFDPGVQQSSDCTYLPGHEAAAPGLSVSCLSQVCLIIAFAWLVQAH